jgi:hypothetical protein
MVRWPKEKYAFSFSLFIDFSHNLQDSLIELFGNPYAFDKSRVLYAKAAHGPE